jgi:tRNA(fMet)-specific endonuclease VapC
MMVLDTDMSIEIMRGNGKVMRKQASYPGELRVSFMTAAELFFGADYSARPAESHALVKRFLAAVPILPFEEAILRRFGILKASLKRSKMLIPDADLFIAATALERGDGLVTGNGRHFARIEGLHIEDWTR